MIDKIKNPYILVPVIIIIGIVIFFTSRGEDDLGFDFTEVNLRNLERTISVTGRVEAAREVNLAFENSGKISVVSVDVGDQVYRGQTLISQVSEGVSADLAQAKARLKSEESKLVELQRGSRPEEIAVQKIKVSSAEIKLNEARQALVDEIKSSFTKADDAVKNKVDQLFSSPNSDSPKINVQVNNVQYRINAESGRVSSGATLNNWGSSISNLSVNSDLESKSAESKDSLLKIQSFLQSMSLIVNSLEANASLSQTTIDGYKSDIFTARSNIDTASINLSTDIEGFRSGASTLNLAREELILMEAGSDPQSILSQEAKVEETIANVQKYQSELNKRFITAPINGLVTFVEVLSGEIVSANEVVVSLISDNNLEVSAKIPETDIVEVLVGNESRVMLDAYSDKVVFDAIVVKIDPAETIVDGVPVYKTTFNFKEQDQRIRSGMTADIDILIIEKENVLAVPRRAVFFKDNIEFIRIWDGLNITEREVETGFISSDGMIEIVSGLSPGENVITFIRDESLTN